MTGVQTCALPILIPTISHTLEEQINIENELLVLENKRLKGEQDRENEIIEDERQMVILKDRENKLDEKIQKLYELSNCKICKISKCACTKIDTFFK